MRIIYCDWAEYTARDAVSVLRDLGYDVKISEYSGNVRKPWDEASVKRFENKLTSASAGDGAFDFVFSFNFFPEISACCEKHGVPYICLVFDSPFYPLTSTEITNDVNHIFTFDRKQAQELKDKGIRTVDYSPLPVNARRIVKQTEGLSRKPYEHEVTFLGQLYRSDDDTYESIRDFLPEHLRNYLDDVIKTQEEIFGRDLIGMKEIVPENAIDEFREHVKIKKSGRYIYDDDDVLLDILRRQVTKNERWTLLERIAGIAQTDLYTFPYKEMPQGVRVLGYADYTDEMSAIFNRTKVNLNITLRTIRSGIPLRVTDVMAAGGFIITTYQEEIENRFKNNEELVNAYTPDDLLEKIKWYLNHDAEREKIAAAGSKKVLAEYDHHKILSDIIKKSL